MYGKYLLDESFAEWPSQIEHHFHPQHPLIFFVGTKSDLSRCSACGNLLKGFAFQCLECNYTLDVFCASLTSTQNYNQQPNHPHSMIICENRKNFELCYFGCKHLFKEGWVYVCLHYKCLVDESCTQWPSQIKHPFHPQHLLKLLLQPPSNCNFLTSRCRACAKVLGDFTFHCSECKFNLDLCCTSLIPTQSFKAIPDEEEFRVQKLGHPHSLILCEKIDFVFICYTCQRCLKDSVYVRLECGILLHKSCVNLPQNVYHSNSLVHKHKHILPLPSTLSLFSNIHLLSWGNLLLKVRS